MQSFPWFPKSGSQGGTCVWAPTATARAKSPQMQQQDPTCKLGCQWKIRLLWPRSNHSGHGGRIFCVHAGVPDEISLTPVAGLSTKLTLPFLQDPHTPSLHIPLHDARALHSMGKKKPQYTTAWDCAVDLFSC